MSSYTINISLPKALARQVKEQVKKGYFSSVSEMVRVALRSLIEPDVPTFKMTKRMEKLVDNAIKEYKSGKLKPVQSLSELE